MLESRGNAHAQSRGKSAQTNPRESSPADVDLRNQGKKKGPQNSERMEPDKSISNFEMPVIVM